MDEVSHFDLIKVGRTRKILVKSSENYRIALQSIFFKNTIKYIEKNQLFHFVLFCVVFIFI